MQEMKLMVTKPHFPKDFGASCFPVDLIRLMRDIYAVAGACKMKMALAGGAP